MGPEEIARRRRRTKPSTDEKVYRWDMTEIAEPTTQERVDRRDDAIDRIAPVALARAGLAVMSSGASTTAIRAARCLRRSISGESPCMASESPAS